MYTAICLSQAPQHTVQLVTLLLVEHYVHLHHNADHDRVSGNPGNDAAHVLTGMKIATGADTDIEPHGGMCCREDAAVANNEPTGVEACNSPGASYTVSCSWHMLSHRTACPSMLWSHVAAVETA